MAEKEDIVMVKETGKFIINDLEKKSITTTLVGKRKRIETADESA